MKKILIADDSANWLSWHAQALRELAECRITLANSARQGYERVTAAMDEPYDIILTDMQMETDFAPLYAGEWLIKQIRFLNEYQNTEIFIISATSNIRQIAEKYGVDYIPKYACKDLAAYGKVFRTPV
ncbi:MAG: response regulator [Heliobacteriaceae bacterium]|jgi:CheY-like chemotaxis protein|nr:response regulator [Heliobacteriaceae bacterium]